MKHNVINSLFLLHLCNPAVWHSQVIVLANFEIKRLTRTGPDKKGLGNCELPINILLCYEGKDKSDDWNDSKSYNIPSTATFGFDLFRLNIVFKLHRLYHKG